jgi:hypothetical protein
MKAEGERRGKRGKGETGKGERKSGGGKGGGDGESPKEEKGAGLSPEKGGPQSSPRPGSGAALLGTAR